RKSPAMRGAVEQRYILPPAGARSRWGSACQCLGRAAHQSVSGSARLTGLRSSCAGLYTICLPASPFTPFAASTKLIVLIELVPGAFAMRFYKRGDVRIPYEEAGRGFPLLLVPGGGLNSRISNWPNAVFNSFEIFKDEFHCITMDQRNANGGESTGPIPASNPWDAFADDQLGLMDHLGIKQFL